MTYRLNEFEFTLPSDEVQDASINILKFAALGTSLIVSRSLLGDGETLQSNFEEQLAKLEKQIHKHRTRLGKRLRDDAFKNGEYEYTEEMDDGVESRPKVVRTKSFPVRSMSIDDAVLQMELLGHSFFAFVNADTDQINVLYLRKDGDLGLLEPEA